MPAFDGELLWPVSVTGFCRAAGRSVAARAGLWRNAGQAPEAADAALLFLAFFVLPAFVPEASAGALAEAVPGAAAGAEAADACSAAAAFLLFFDFVALAPDAVPAAAALAVGVGVAAAAAAAVLAGAVPVDVAGFAGTVDMDGAAGVMDGAALLGAVAGAVAVDGAAGAVEGGADAAVVAGAAGAVVFAAASVLFFGMALPVGGTDEPLIVSPAASRLTTDFWPMPFTRAARSSASLNGPFFVRSSMIALA